MKRVILALAITSLVLTLGGIGLFMATDARYCNLLWIAFLYRCPTEVASDALHFVQLLFGLGLLAGFASGLMGISATNLAGRWGCLFGIWHFGMLLVLLVVPVIPLVFATAIDIVLAQTGVNPGLVTFAFNAFLFVPLLLLPLPALIYSVTGPEGHKEK